ncbi:jg24971 [Pararge aegeria aegeria]|uniref:Jg24971 protein n=1 Tax=Pararge aegeria aegeria TaxID=348720 RepID=A0A8S4QU52_9NEOP|nr:jg24971 [Pararge aegeria aegeria]
MVMSSPVRVDKLLSTARQKISMLIQAISKMDVNDEVRATARLFYHNILARFMRDNYNDEVVAEGGMGTLFILFIVANYTMEIGN